MPSTLPWLCLYGCLTLWERRPTQQKLHKLLSAGKEELTAAHCLLTEVLHIDAMIGVFSYLQMLAVRGAQQVCERLVIDLQEAALAPHRPLDVALQSVSLSHMHSYVLTEHV